MRWCLLIITASLINNYSNGLSCSYYPSGDATRFTLMDPEYFDFDGFTAFYYSSYFFYRTYDYEDERNSIKPLIDEEAMKNILLWQKSTQGRVDIYAIYEAVYKMHYSKINQDCKNKFIQQLYKEKKSQTIAYIRYIKKVASFNTFHTDPWERNDEKDFKIRVKSLQEIKNRLKVIDDRFLQRRYAFLGIRLAYYNNQTDVMNELWEHYFSKSEEKDIIHYWALFYWNVHQKPSSDRTYSFVQIFYHASGKRKAIRSNYLYNFDSDTLLHLFPNKENQVQIQSYKSIRNPGRSLKEIKKIYQLEGGSHFLNFLLLREVSKLEDWLVTPKIILDEPSVYSFVGEKYYYEIPNKRYYSDKKYARKLLAFIKKNKKKKGYVWDLTEAYLNYLLGNYSTAKKQLKRGLKHYKHDKKQLLLSQILILVNVASNDKNSTLLNIKFPERIKRSKFLLALAKEYEKKGRIKEAIVVYSLIEETYGREYGDEIIWKAPKNISHPWGNTFNEYLFYIDYISNTKELTSLISFIKANSLNPKFTNLVRDLPRIYDLLGTKYLRRNQLKKALKAFRNVGDSLYLEYPYNYYLKANPFSADLNSNHRETKFDTVSYTKTQIVEKLLYHLSEVKKSTNKSYHYNLIANCYFNMTYHGNSWMMKRYFWSTGEFKNGLVDQKEYFRANQAQKYYLKAKQYAPIKTLKAYYLAMSGKCKEYELEDIYYADSNWEKRSFPRNIYYNQISHYYEEYGDILLSTCLSYNRSIKH